MNKKYYDLSASFSENMVRYPGDPKCIIEEINSLEKGAVFALSEIKLGNHAGTHIDFPSHIILGGKNSSDFFISELIGDGIIIEVPINQLSITKDFILRQEIMPNDIVFFKTSNTHISKYKKIISNYVYIEQEAAWELVNRKARIVGIDYLNVDKDGEASLPVHQILLSNDALIVEGLELYGVPAGRCIIYIMPMKINNMDGLPARVVAKI